MPPKQKFSRLWQNLRLRGLSRRHFASMKIYKEFRIEAAHRLPNLPAEHKCSRLHGHSFHIVITVEGPLQQPQGWVRDFAELGEAFQPLFEQLDHRYLNEIEGLENPTSENLAIWIWRRLRTTLPGLVEVEVRETCTSGCRYCGG